MPNAATGMTDVKITDEDGNLINRSSFGSIEEARVYFQEVRDELATNEQLEIVQVNSFHFEYKKLKKIEGV